MNIITNRPIISDKISNKSTMSSFDDFSYCCGMSSFDDSFSYADDTEGEGTKGKNLEAVKTYLGQQKTERKTGREKAVTDILADKTAYKTVKRTNRATSRETRQSERKLRREARHTRKTNRKANRNAKKLILVKTSRGEKFFFPLSRVRLGKKAYKDGTKVEVDPKDQVKVFDQKTKEEVVLDKKEVANALDKPVGEVTNADAQKLIQQLTLEIEELKTLKAETGDKLNENPYGVMVDDSKLQVVNDGEAYLTSQTQDKDKADEDVKDKENGLSKTQKVVLWSAVAVVVGLVGFAIYKSVKK